MSRRMPLLILVAGFIVNQSLLADDLEVDCAMYAKAESASLVPGQEAAFAQAVAEFLKPGRNIISYGGYVDENGKLSHAVASINSKSSPRKLGRLRAVVEELDFRPAALDGAHLLVYLTLMAVIDKRENGSIGITMFNNHGPLFDDFGADDVSPQRVGLFGGQPLLFNAVAIAGQVSVDGRLRDVEILKRIDATIPQVQYLENRLTSLCYVPGKSDGSPREMTYYEVFERVQ